MPKGRRIWIALVAISLFILGASGWADSNLDQLKCLLGHSSQISLAKDVVPSKGGTPRDQVLLEIFMRPT